MLHSSDECGYDPPLARNIYIYISKFQHKGVALRQEQWHRTGSFWTLTVTTNSSTARTGAPGVTAVRHNRGDDDNYSRTTGERIVQEAVPAEWIGTMILQMIIATNLN